MKHAITTTIQILITVFCVAAQAAPDGYSINSDSASNLNSDSLYVIDLATGAHTRLGRVQSQGQIKIDVEGLAFAPDGTLYGVDDDSMTLFPINTTDGVVLGQQEVNISGMPSGGGNDFGLTFACDGNLYATSVATKALYRIGPDGVAIQIGATGSLGANISALAAYGNPVQLYGLGNGLTGEGTVDSRRLYAIDAQTGQATALPQELGAAVDPYNQAGLAFDSAGTLWAITDRRAALGGDFPSQIIRIDTSTGIATHSAVTAEQGFESLAITPPQGCNADHEDETPEIVELTVHKEWLFSKPELEFSESATIKLTCEDVNGGNGVSVNGDMVWTWVFNGNDSHTAIINPKGVGNSICYATEYQVSSAVEITSGCEWGVPVDVGGADQSCTIINTVFVEGVPALSRSGLLLFIILMLTTGLITLRRP